eukprot:GHVS01064189.1.p1 GENE.GHVS01064189.1~~GHVS01064189.1.p1  ORF type:complete len:383 (+),score=70.48 GHVS01064189.1:45-1193(+)
MLASRRLPPQWIRGRAFFSCFPLSVFLLDPLVLVGFSCCNTLNFHPTPVPIASLTGSSSPLKYSPFLLVHSSASPQSHLSRRYSPCSSLLSFPPTVPNMYRHLLGRWRCLKTIRQHDSGSVSCLPIGSVEGTVEFVPLTLFCLKEGLLGTTQLTDAPTAPTNAGATGGEEAAQQDGFLVYEEKGTYMELPGDQTGVGGAATAALEVYRIYLYACSGDSADLYFVDDRQQLTGVCERARRHWQAEVNSPVKVGDVNEGEGGSQNNDHLAIAGALKYFMALPLLRSPKRSSSSSSSNPPLQEDIGKLVSSSQARTDCIRGGGPADSLTAQRRHQHWCRDDLYTLFVEWRSKDEMAYQWRIQGPRKNLSIEQAFYRITTDKTPTG